MSGLPEGLADALHYPQPSPWGWVAGAVLLMLALGAWMAWSRRRRAEPAPAAPAAPPPAPAPASRFEDEIRKLLRRYRGEARTGCHELARLLRRHVGRRRGEDLTRRTARELERQLGDTRLARLFTLLSELQFGRRRPGDGDLVGICELALEVAGGEPEKRR